MAESRIATEIFVADVQAAGERDAGRYQQQHRPLMDAEGRQEQRGDGDDFETREAHQSAAPSEAQQEPSAELLREKRRTLTSCQSPSLDPKW